MLCKHDIEALDEKLRVCRSYCDMIDEKLKRLEKLRDNPQSPVESEDIPEELDYNASYHPTD